jgi:aspartate/methionine/tyrosine aminotransferase
MPLLAENNFLPVLADIPAPVLAQARMMVLSYPHNPTTAVAPLAFFREAVAFCQQHDLVLVHDFPYVDLVFAENGESGVGEESRGAAEQRSSGELDARVPLSFPSPQPLAPSILQADPEKSVSIEFFTLSKSYNMGGFRVGYAIGNPRLIAALRQVKAVVDFNQYRGILNGAIAALSGDQTGVQRMVATFRQRRDRFASALDSIGWQVSIPQATMYIWAKLPAPWDRDSVSFCTQLVEATGVAVSPGAGFGKFGEGYVRFALVRSPEVLETAVERIAQFLRG